MKGFKNNNIDEKILFLRTYIEHDRKSRESNKTDEDFNAYCETAMLSIEAVIDAYEEEKKNRKQYETLSIVLAESKGK